MQLQRRTASRGGSHFLMFRLPWSLAPQVAPTAQVLLPAGSRGVYTTPWTGSHLPELWNRYMTESDNCHGGSFTRWTAALSAATLHLQRMTLSFTTPCRFNRRNRRFTMIVSEGIQLWPEYHKLHSKKHNQNLQVSSFKTDHPIW